jgi:hypothetical protein
MATSDGLSFSEVRHIDGKFDWLEEIIIGEGGDLSTAVQLKEVSDVACPLILVLIHHEVLLKGVLVQAKLMYFQLFEHSFILILRLPSI